MQMAVHAKQRYKESTNERAAIVEWAFVSAIAVLIS